MWPSCKVEDNHTHDKKQCVANGDPAKNSLFSLASGKECFSLASHSISFNFILGAGASRKVSGRPSIINHNFWTTKQQITTWDIKHLNKKTTGATHPPRPEMSTKKVAYFYDDEIGNFHYGSVLFCVLRCPFCSYMILFSPSSFNTTLLFYTDIHTQ